MKKSWWKSKVIWVNILTIAVWIFTGLSGIVTAPWLVAFFGSALGVVNIMLRIVTNSSISDVLFTVTNDSRFDGVPDKNRSYSITETHIYNHTDK